MNKPEYDKLKAQIKTESEKIIFEELTPNNIQELGSNIADAMYNCETGDWEIH